MAPRKRINTRYKIVLRETKREMDVNWGILFVKNRTYEVLKAANVPLGMSVDGALRSPLMLMPDKIPVTVGKNTPKTRNHVYPSCRRPGRIKLDTSTLLDVREGSLNPPDSLRTDSRQSCHSTSHRLRVRDRRP